MPIKAVYELATATEDIREQLETQIPEAPKTPSTAEIKAMKAERLALTAARPEPPPNAAPPPILAAVQTEPEIATQDQGTPEPEAPKAEPSAWASFWRRFFGMG